jgi:uncharacterized membrane protein YedE/YeeE
MAQSPAGQDWTVQVADRIDSVVGTIRDKTIVPVSTVARALVYGIIAGLLGVVALILVAVGAIRALNVYLPFHVGASHARSVWVSDAIVGGIFVVFGWFLFLRKANAKAKR